MAPRLVPPDGRILIPAGIGLPLAPDRSLAVTLDKPALAQCCAGRARVAYLDASAGFPFQEYLPHTNHILGGRLSARARQTVNKVKDRMSGKIHLR